MPYESLRRVSTTGTYQKQENNVTQTSLCSASYASWRRGTPRICCCVPCCGAAAADRRPCSNRSISSGRRAHSSDPTVASSGVRMRQTDRQTDGQTDGRTDDRQTGAHTVSVRRNGLLDAFSAYTLWIHFEHKLHLLVIIIISFSSPTLSFIPDLKPFFSKSLPLQPFFFFFRTDYMIPQTFTVTSNISAFTL